MFLFDTVSLTDYLAPSVLTGGFGTQSYQQLCGELKILVAFAIRENEVRFLVVLRHNLLFKDQVAGGEDAGQMVFQRLTSA